MSFSVQRTFISVATLLLAVALLAPPPGLRADVSDTISVVKEGEELGNVEIVSRLAEATFAGTTQRVLIGREDNFADNMASAVMQSDSPLLLVPSEGPISPRVADLLAQFAPSEVVLLGGEAAISSEVEAELAEDFTVVRRSGPTRFETAIDIAEKEAPTATTAVLARGFASPDSTDESQAFADSLAAGGWAADNGWPVLLTATDTLPGSVRGYLDTSAITEVKIMGGTAAISPAVEAELGSMGIATTRVAGPTRFGTAIAVAEMRGADSAADADRVVLVEGQASDAWAGGFAAAAHSAAFNAPVILANGDGIPPETADFLAGGGAFAQNGFFDDAVLTCVTVPSTCEQARVTRGLPAQTTVTFDPASGSTIEAGSTIAVTVTGSTAGAIEVTSDCAADVTGTGEGTYDVTTDSSASGDCTLTATIALPSGASQVETATYTIEPADAGVVTAVFLGEYQYVVGGQETRVEIGENDTFFVDGQPASQSIFQQSLTQGDRASVTSSFAQTSQQHALMNVDVEDITSGMVGNVDLFNDQASIIEPVSGIALRDFPLSGGLYTVDGANVTEQTLLEEISEGDQVILGEDAAQTPTIALTNGQLNGPIDLVSTGFAGFRQVTFRILTGGGLPTSPQWGDDPLFADNGLFFITSDEPGELSIEGDPATYLEFEAAINDGDVVTYYRTGDLQFFDLVNGRAPAEGGLATETYELSSTGDAELVVEGVGRQLFTYDLLDGRYVVNGLVSTVDDFRDAYSPGDWITVSPATNDLPQEVTLEDRFLMGGLADITPPTTYSYDVINDDGTIYQNLTYTGVDPFNNGVNDNRYYVDGVEVALADFHAALDSADLDVATIEVRRAGDEGVGPANEHRLHTGA